MTDQSESVSAAGVIGFLAIGGRAERVLAEHVDDGTSHCAICSAGPQAGRMRWPCRLAAYAGAAAEQSGGAG